MNQGMLRAVVVGLSLLGLPALELALAEFLDDFSLLGGFGKSGSSFVDLALDEGHFLGDGEGFAACGADLVSDFLQSRVCQVQAGDVGARLGEANGDSAADSASGAGDERGLLVEAEQCC